MAIQPHAFEPAAGSTRCAVCNSPRLAMIHAVSDFDLHPRKPRPPAKKEDRE